jgi:hypothetical protein
VGLKGAVKAPLFNLSTDSCLKTTSNFEQFLIGIFTNTHTHRDRDREREKFIRILVSEPSGQLNSRMGQMSEKEKKRERKRERIPKIHHNSVSSHTTISREK